MLRNLKFLQFLYAFQGVTGSYYAYGSVTEENCGVFYGAIVEAKKNETPTTKRREDRFVTGKENADNFFAKLHERFGNAMRLRDIPDEGFNNVTVTEYPRRFPLPGERTATLRLRKYGKRPLGTTDDYELTGDSVNTAKVEFKVDDPDAAGAKYKPGISMKDEDIEKMLANEASFKEHYKEILKNTLALKVHVNPNDPPLNQDLGLVVEMLDSVKKLYKEAAKEKSLKQYPEMLRPNFQVEYERGAEEIQFADRKTGEKIRVQVTVDKNIKSQSPGTRDNLVRYADGQRVIEVKLPVAYLNLSPEELKERAPELLEIMAMAKGIDLDPAFKPGAGKYRGLGNAKLAQDATMDAVSDAEVLDVKPDSAIAISSLHNRFPHVDKFKIIDFNPSSHRFTVLVKQGVGDHVNYFSTEVDASRPNLVENTYHIEKETYGEANSIARGNEGSAPQALVKPSPANTVVRSTAPPPPPPASRQVPAVLTIKESLDKYADEAMACVRRRGIVSPQQGLQVIAYDANNFRIEGANWSAHGSGFVANMEISRGVLHYSDPVSGKLVPCR